MGRRAGVAAAIAGVCGCLVGCGRPGPVGPPVALRAEHLTVTPSTGPLTHVLVHNLHDRTYRGTVTVKFPPGWKMNKTQQEVTIQPRAAARVAFAIERGADAPDNSYPVEMKAVGAGTEVERKQRIVCASAPYFKPTIDGRTDDWADAIPVTFTAGGKKTTVSTYWSRRRFSALVAVEEDTLTRMPAEHAGDATFDAVQIALAPAGAKTPDSPKGYAQRYEFLLAPTATGARCFALIEPGGRAAAVALPRTLAGLSALDAELVISRANGVTYYEWSVPLEAMPQIRADPGREFCLSLLVHDPDGTGLRDWGQAAGLWPWQRSRLAWCNWRGAVWPKQPPYDSKIEWGFCSSKR